jgi:hypothetical protein
MRIEVDFSHVACRAGGNTVQAGGHESGMDRDIEGFVVNQISKFEGFAPMPARGTGMHLLVQTAIRREWGFTAPRFASQGLCLLVCDELCPREVVQVDRSGLSGCRRLCSVIRSFRRISVRPLGSSGAGSCAFHGAECRHPRCRQRENLEPEFLLLVLLLLLGAADPRSENLIKKVDAVPLGLKIRTKMRPHSPPSKVRKTTDMDDAHGLRPLLPRPPPPSRETGSGLGREGTQLAPKKSHTRIACEGCRRRKIKV